MASSSKLVLRYITHSRCSSTTRIRERIRRATTSRRSEKMEKGEPKLSLLLSSNSALRGRYSLFNGLTHHPPVALSCARCQSLTAVSHHPLGRSRTVGCEIPRPVYHPCRREPYTYTREMLNNAGKLTMKHISVVAAGEIGGRNQVRANSRNSMFETNPEDYRYVGF